MNHDYEEIDLGKDMLNLRRFYRDSAFICGSELSHLLSGCHIDDEDRIHEKTKSYLDIGTIGGYRTHWVSHSIDE